MSVAGKYSEERVEIVLESLRNGAPRKYAAEAAGVSASALADWMERVEGLRAKVEQAEGAFVDASIRGIQKAAIDPRNWQAHAWLLERRFPTEFGRQDRMKLEMEQTLSQVRAAAEAEGLDPDEAVAEAKRMLGVRG